MTVGNLLGSYANQKDTIFDGGVKFQKNDMIKVQSMNHNCAIGRFKRADLYGYLLNEPEVLS